MNAASQTGAGETTTMRFGPLPPGVRWQPIEGNETQMLLERFSDLDAAGKAKVRNEAVSILSRCMRPTQPDSQITGLVLGQVQSGKTMSFTTVAALARDNGYRLVIVITGTTIPLLGQSVGRLRSDLGVDLDHRSWRHIPVSPKAPINRQAVLDALEEWGDARVTAAERRTLLITVMKQHKNLQKLVDLLQTISMADVPTLIIEDEGDQASLNTKIRNSDESTTYQKLVALRRCLPRHTFLQYTATPQALLLINIINVLSPAFAELLTPGDEYTGGHAFFIQCPQLVRTIPPQDLPSPQSPLTGPPESLFEAMRLFYVGVAAGLHCNAGGNRSMLIHPSVKRDDHAQFHHWVVTTKDEWKEILKRPVTDPDRIELLDEFKQAYDDLAVTVPDLAPWSDVKEKLILAFWRTQVEKVNTSSGTTPTIDWSDSYGFILVGGTAMDRGYTVRGLTVTYMPRGLGGGQADTLQQRGRFFGYKRSYLPYCRVFLEAGVVQAFRDYVEHEEDVRGRLMAHRQIGRPLTDWPRAFLLDTAMRPTRNNVIDIAYSWATFGDDWFIPKAPHDSVDAIQNNRGLVGQIESWWTFNADSGNPNRTEHQKHRVAHNLKLTDVYEKLLAVVRFTRFRDSQSYISLLLVLKQIIENDVDTRSVIYRMSGGAARERSLDDTDEIPTLFQGAAPVTPKSKRGTIYPGDSEIRDGNLVTIQIHNVTVGLANGEVIADVPTVAIWVPARYSRDLLVQPQGRQS